MRWQGDVRVTTGVPTAAMFANATGSPLLIDSATGYAYFLTAAGVVTQLTVPTPTSDSAIAGRLTLTSGVPVTTADVTGATNIFWTPYKGNTIVLWNGAAWMTYTYVEITLPLGTLASASIPNDIFAFVSGGVVGIEKLAWTNSSTRATAVTLQDGRYCKSGDKTRLYLGSFYPTSTTTTEDSEGGVTAQVGGKRLLWNHYNQVERGAHVIDAGSWNYSVAAMRQANGAIGNRVDYMIGLPTFVSADTLHIWASTVPANVAGGVGIDSATVNSAKTFGTTSMQGSTVTSTYREQIAAGFHNIYWLEMAFGGGTQTWYATAGPQIQSGMQTSAIM